MTIWRPDIQGNDPGYGHRHPTILFIYPSANVKMPRVLDAEHSSKGKIPAHWYGILVPYRSGSKRFPGPPGGGTCSPWISSMDSRRGTFSEGGDTVKVALYARVSTEGQDPAGQKMRLYEYAKGQGWEVFDYYEDKASGKDDSRPDLDRMMSDAGIRKEGPRVRPKFGVILVTKLDRMMRSLVNMENIVKDLEGQKCGSYRF